MINGKKVLSAMLAVLLTFGIACPGVAAAGTADTPAFVVESKSAAAGDTVDIPIKAINNGKIAAVNLDVTYDTERLSLTKITGNAEWGGSFTLNTSPATIVWYDGTNNHTPGDSVFATLSFEVLDNAAAGDANISVEYDEDNVYQLDEEHLGETINIAYAVENGCVTVTAAPTATATATVTTPTRGVTLATTVTCSSDAYTGTVAWYEGDTAVGVPVTGTAKADQVYTAQITLTPTNGNSFADSVSVAVNSDAAQTVAPNEAGALVITKTFPATAAKELSALTVEQQPNKKTYVHGDTFDTTGLVVKAAYNDGSTDDNFKGYEVVYPNYKNYLTKDTTSVTLKVGEKEATISDLTVNAKPLTITGVTATDKEYDGTTAVTLSGGILNGVVPGETVNLVSTGATGTVNSADVGTQTVDVSGYTIEGSDAGNYTLTQPTNVTVNIAPKNISDAAITLDGTLTYTGTSQTQNISSVTLDVKTLTKDTDYTVSGNTGTIAGAYTLTITGTGNYTGTANKTWKIEPADLNAATIEAVADQSYTGSQITPTPAVTLNGKTLTADTDFTYTYDDNQYVGTGTVNISGKGNYTGSVVGKTFSITAVDQTPAITATANLTKGGNTLDLSTLVSGAKGDVSFSIDSGNNSASLSGNTLTSTDTTGDVKITVKITAKDEGGDNAAEYNAYTGTEAITVTVTDKNVDSTTMTVTQSDCTYSETLGNYALTGKPDDAGTDTVLYTGTTLSGTTYDSSTAPTDAGTYKVTVICETNDTIYSATSAEFTIAPKSIESATVTLGEALTYNGNSQTQSVSSVTLGEKTLTEDTDYTVSGNTGTNAGTYTLTVAAKDDSNYTGSVTKAFSIAKKPITPTVEDIANVGYTGSAQEPTVTVKDGDITLATADYSVAYSSNINAGTATATITAKDDGNYTFEAVTVHFTIQKVAHEAASASGSARFGTSGTVDLSALLAEGYQIGTVSVSDNDSVLNGTPSVTDGKLSFSFAKNRENVGKTATVTVPVTSSTNYNAYDITVTLTVTDKETPSVAADDITVTYTGSPVPASNITGTATFGSGTVAGAWSFKDTAPTTVAQSGSCTVVFTPADTDTYDSVETNITVTISKATPTGTPSYTAITTSGKTLADAGLAIGTITPAGGTIAWNDASTTTVASNTSYGWTYTPADTNNYNTLTGSITLYQKSSSGSGGGGGGSASYSISASSKVDNGSVSVSPKNASKGDTVTITVKPDSGYELDKLTVSDKNGNTVKVTEKNGKYTFTMPASKVTVNASFVKTQAETPSDTGFTDVTNSAYYADAVKWAVDEGITSGTTASTFSPDATCTRAQMVTFLWRAAGSPAPKNAANPFTDVSASAYYYGAVLWAVEQGITSGVSEDRFAPDATVTRGQTVTFLYRASGSPAATGSASFSDVSADAYYADAVQWAVENDITAGTGNNQFSPDNDCTRGQIVTFLYQANE